MIITSQRCIEMVHAAGYSTRDLARALGLPDATVYAWASGSSPSYENYVRLCRTVVDLTHARLDAISAMLAEIAKLKAEAEE